MCFCSKQEVNKPKTPRSPRSPWRRHLREPLRPRLSRAVVSSARINLNLCWGKFEELSKQKLSLVTFDIPNTTDLLRTPVCSSYRCDNEINENLDNEMKERGKQ